MIVDTKEKLEEALSKVGIVGEWIEFTFKGEKPLHLKIKE